MLASFVLDNISKQKHLNFISTFRTYCSSIPLSCMDQSRSAISDSCIGTDGLFLVSECSPHSQHSFDQTYCECYFHVHILDLSEHYFLIFLIFEQCFQECDISFGILLANIVENSVIDVTGAKA